MPEILNMSQTQTDNNQYLLEKRYELLLDINNKKLFKEINDLRENIKRLENEIQNLKTAQRIAVQKTIIEPAEPVAIERKQSNDSHENKEINPQEVSIEKYFYFGKK